MILKHIKDMGEEQITRLATRLLSNESFVVALQAIVSRTLRTREQIEDGLRVVLASLAVPTSEDMESLADRIAAIEERIEELGGRLEEIEEAPSEERRRAAEG